MNNLSNLILHESAHSALAFRARAYRNPEVPNLVREIIALSNSATTGQRLLIIGVDDSPGMARTFPGVSAGTVKKLKEVLPILLSRTVDPQITVSVTRATVRDKTLAVIALLNCDNRPYLLKRNISASMRAGVGWIRRGTSIAPLLRSDLDDIFNARLSQAETPRQLAESTPQRESEPESESESESESDNHGGIRLGFAGAPPKREIELAVLPLAELPSNVAAAKIKKMIEAKEHARAMFGKTETHIQRLVHAQVFDPDAVYEERSDETLLGQLTRVQDDYHLSDAHYKYEVRTHRVQLIIENRSDSDLIDAALELKIPLIEGLGVSDTLYTETGEVSPQAYSYPKVSSDPHAVYVHSKNRNIGAGTAVTAFREPPRIWIRERAAGRTIELYYRVHSSSLPAPLTGTLRIHVAKLR